MQHPKDYEPVMSNLMQDIEHGVRRAQLREQENLRQRVHMRMGNTIQETDAAARYLDAHQRSAELMRYSASRGMSRAAMERIWGQRLVNAVISTESKS
jgi:hypothetical protein